MSLNITTHHYPSQHTTTHHCPSLHITFHHHISLHITTYYYTSLSITIHHYTSLSITTHHCPSLHITVHHYLLLPITHHHYPSLHITTHHKGGNFIYPMMHRFILYYQASERTWCYQFNRDVTVEQQWKATCFADKTFCTFAVSIYLRFSFYYSKYISC